MRFANPVLGPRIVPFGESHKASDKLPNGRQAFRVTSLFGPRSIRMPDGSILNDVHDGLDLGNRNIGDAVIAMAAGRVAYIQAKQGIVRIDHGSGWSTGYAHMTHIGVAVGQSVTVGRQLGRVGNEGTSTGAHLHFDTTRNGVRLNPWPLLAQNQEEDVIIPAGLTPVARGVVNAGVNLREQPSLTATARLTDSRIFVQLYGYRPGDAVGGDSKWAWIGAFGRTWFVHSSLLSELEVLEPSLSSDCTSAIAEATQKLRNRLNRKNTALDGAIQAVQAARAI